MVKPLMNHPKFRRVAAPLALGVTLLLIWQISLQQMNVPVYLIPKPTDIGHALVSQSGLLFGSLWVTLKVTLLAFICAVVIGTLIAFLFVQSRVIEASFKQKSR